MATLQDAMDQTRIFLEANLPVGVTSLKIEWPNTQIKRPLDAYWMRVFWANTGAISKDATHCYEISEGIMYMDLNCPKNNATGPDVRKMEDLKNLFLQNTFLDVITVDAIVDPVGPVGDWYVVQLRLTFQYEGYINA